MTEDTSRVPSLLRHFRPSTAQPARPSLQAAVPFLVVGGIGLGMALLPPYDAVHAVEVGLVLIGFAASLALVLAAIRRSRRTVLDQMPAFVFFASFALARDASGGANSGLAPLIVVPILWIALTGTRRHLVISAVLTAAVFLLPVLLLGAPEYPVAEWRRGMVWTAVAVFIAPVVQRLVSELARQRRLQADANSEMEAILSGARLTCIVAYDLSGTIRSFSAGAEEILGWRAADVIGREGSALFHDCDEVAEVARTLGVEPGFDVFRTLAETSATSRVWTVIRADGDQRLVQLVLTELLDANGERFGYLSVAIDVTAEVRAERELAESETRWRTLLDQLPDTTVMLVDDQLHVRAVGGQSTLRRHLDEALGQSLADFSTQENLAQLRPLVDDALAGHEGSLEIRASADGAEHEVVVTPLPPGADGPQVLVVIRDVSRDRARERAVDAARRRAERLFADAPHGVAVLHPDGRIERVNEAMRLLVGVDSGELEGTSLQQWAGRGASTLESHLASVRTHSASRVSTDCTLQDAQGQDLHVVVSSRLLDGADDTGEDLVLMNVVDVAERRRYEQRLAHLAEHDPLTGLANRRRFDEELQHHQEARRRYGPTGAVLVLDLDQFKDVNDSLGHGAGDQLIISIATLLRQTIRSTDVVARLGGDEFAVLLTEGGRDAAAAVGQLIVERVREHTMTLDGTRQRVTVSVGGVTYEDAARTDADILALAEMVMYDAKEDGRNRCVVFDGTKHKQPRLGARLEWKQRVEQALVNDDFVLHLQPIRDLAAGGVHSAEALLRLADADELVAPARFLYVAEQAGLGPDIDRWVVRHAVALLARLRRHDPQFALEVNLSGHSIGDPRIEEAIVEALHEHDVDPSALILEITETAAVSDVELARGFAERMTELGCKFALDDFGAGFGSFYYLKHLLFDYVKIDGEFVAHCHTSAVDRTILRSIVGIARDLGKRTVAEFVSEEAILDVIRAEGVDLAQGFLIGRPMPVDDFIASLDPTDRDPTGPEHSGADR